MRKLHNKGFTITELLIASMVFTTVLMLCMEGITRIAKVYIKNTSTSRANDFAKTLMNDLSGQIKYGSSAPEYISDVVSGAETKFICSAGKAYKITLNKKDTTSVQKKADSTCESYSDPNYYSDADNIAPQSMRLLDFQYKESGNLSNLAIRVAVGDTDLMEDSSGAELADTSTYEQYSLARCKNGISGGEFCSVIGLTTTVTRRK